MGLLLEGCHYKYESLINKPILAFMSILPSYSEVVCLEGAGERSGMLSPFTNPNQYKEPEWNVYYITLYIIYIYIYIYKCIYIYIYIYITISYSISTLCREIEEMIMSPCQIFKIAMPHMSLFSFFFF